MLFATAAMVAAIFLIDVSAFDAVTVQDFCSKRFRDVALLL